LPVLVSHTKPGVVAKLFSKLLIWLVVA
jgi:hypothetical protein